MEVNGNRGNKIDSDPRDITRTAVSGSSIDDYKTETKTNETSIDTTIIDQDER